MRQERKRYHPVRVKDPSSDNHIVRVRPGQECLLVLSSTMANSIVHVESDYIKLQRENEYNGYRFFYFSQKYDFSSWAEAGRCFLGNIKVSSELLQRTTNVVVVLESPNTDVFTVINPADCVVKISPENTLEVVLHDPKFESTDTWNCRYIPDDKNSCLNFQQVRGELLAPPLIQYDNAIRRAFDKTSLEWHFWFEFDWSSKIALDNMAVGVHDAGKLIFEPEGFVGFSHEVVLLASVKNRLTEIPRRQLKQQQVRVINSSSHSKNHKPPHYTNEYADDFSAWPVKNYHVKYKSKDTYGTREVKLAEVDSGDIDDNCQVIFFENSDLIKMVTE